MLDEYFWYGSLKLSLPHFHSVTTNYSSLRPPPSIHSPYSLALSLSSLLLQHFPLAAIWFFGSYSFLVTKGINLYELL